MAFKRCADFGLLLQPALGCHCVDTSSCYRAASVALPTRRLETKGQSAAAPDLWSFDKPVTLDSRGSLPQHGNEVGPGALYGPSADSHLRFNYGTFRRIC